MSALEARKGDPITCKNGHPAGRFRQDVFEDRGIVSEDLAFSDKDLILGPGAGYQCPECQEPVAFLSQPTGRWKVRTAALGWIS
jgi:hypothetical protein